jgi:hypothetical protein
MNVLKTVSFDYDAVGGVAFDGRAIWLTTVSRAKGHHLLSVDPVSGDVLSSETSEHMICGLAWDGERMWRVVQRQGLERFDPRTGEVTRRLPLPADGFISGLAWDGEALWVGARERNRIFKVDPETGAVLREIASDRHVTGITWVNDRLWHGAAVGSFPEDGMELRRLDADGTVAERHEVPFYVSGLAFDGDSLLCGDCVTSTLRVVAAPQGDVHA